MVTNQERLIADAERRVNRAWQEDGLPELGAGCFLLLMGTASLGERFAGWSPLVVLAAVFGGALITNRAVVAGKARLSDRRVGYVRPRNESWELYKRYWWVVGLAAAAIGAINGAAGDVIPGWQFLRDWWGLLLVATGAIAAVQQRTPWYAALALIPLAYIALGEAGLVAQETAFGWCCLALGAASLAIGAWRLVRFLRAQRTPAGA